MIPGEILPGSGAVALNAGRETITLIVANTGDRPVQVGSHFHFAQANAALSFDRDLAWGCRLNVPAGTAVRFEPGVEREVSLADYFTGYRTSVRAAHELIRAVRIPLPLAGLTAFHKIAKRRFDDISSVAVAFAIDHDDTGIVQRARVGLGGVAATPLRAGATEAALVGRAWTRETVAAAADILGAEGTPMSDHRASTRYRAAMLRSSLLKLHAETDGFDQ